LIGNAGGELYRKFSAGEFQAQADKMLPTLNLPYAVRIDGLFRAVKTRAPRRQARPYPRLIDPLADQPDSRLFARGLQSVRPPVQKPGRGGPSCKRSKQEKGNPARRRIPFRYSGSGKGGVLPCDPISQGP
jgi:hypothetical protein